MCDFKNHDWKEIFSVDIGWNEERTIYWCRYCGTTIVAKESDNRMFGSIKHTPRLVVEKHKEIQAGEKN
jgi:hypothetical protein